jgi:hypothetical protein
MPRSFSSDEWELMDIPRRLAYEQSRFDNPRPHIVGAGPGCATIDQIARVRHAALLVRQTELKYQIRRRAVLARWVMRKYRLRLAPLPIRPISPLIPMLIDEVIEHGKIVDRG